MDHSKDICWIFYNTASVLYLVFFVPEACGILVPRSGIKLTPPALKEVLTAGLPGSPNSNIFDFQSYVIFFSLPTKEYYLVLIKNKKYILSITTKELELYRIS